MIRFDPFASYLSEPVWVVVENGPRAFVHKLREGSRSGALAVECPKPSLRIGRYCEASCELCLETSREIQSVRRRSPESMYYETSEARGSRFSCCTSIRRLHRTPAFSLHLAAYELTS